MERDGSIQGVSGYTKKVMNIWTKCPRMCCESIWSTFYSPSMELQELVRKNGQVLYHALLIHPDLIYPVAKGWAMFSIELAFK